MLTCTSVDNSHSEDVSANCEAETQGCVDAEADGEALLDGDASEDVVEDQDAGDSWAESADCVELERDVFFPPVYFFKPEGEPRPPLTKEYLRGTLESAGSAFKALLTYRPADHHREGDGDFNLFAFRDEDVELSVGMALNGLREGDVFFLTAMIDYEPVEFGYTRWLTERGEDYEAGTSRGIRFEMDDSVELFDIVLDASHFKPEHVHQVSIVMAKKSLTHRRIDRENFVDFTLYFEGYEFPDLPACFEDALRKVANSIEEEIFLELGNRDGVLFVPDVQDAENIQEPVHVAPGETVPLNLSIIENRWPPTRPSVAVPFLNGEPLDEKWFFIHALRTEDSLDFEVSLRKEFEVTLPEEPGTYDVFVSVGREPFLPSHDLDGERIERQSAFSSVATNIVRFVVEEDTE
jgi:hypothetical protein